MGQGDPRSRHQGELTRLLNMAKRDMPVVGIMTAGREEPVARFKAGMREHGFVEGDNIVFQVRSAHGDAAKLADFADDRA